MTRPSTADDPPDPIHRTKMVTPPASPADATVDSALRDALDLYGSGLVFEPARLRVLLEERCPHARHDVASVLKALDAQVPQALVSTHDGAKLRKLARALEKKLRDQYVMNRYAAAWTVRTWADALGLDGLAATEASEDAAPPAKESPGPVDQPATASALHREAATPSLEPQTAMSSPASTASSPSDGSPSTDGRPSTRHPWLRAALALGFIAAAAVLLRYVDGPPAVDEPPSSATHIATARGTTSRVDAIAAATTSPAPAAAAGGPSPRSTPPVAAMSPSATQASVATPLVEPPEIVDVASSEALIGDGRQRELLVTLRTPHPDIESVAFRFVSGDALLATRPTVIAVSGRARRDDRVPAGLIGVRTSRDVRARFEYIVTTIDGRRSAPFVKELIVAAGSPAPLAIGAIEAPTPLVGRSPKE